MDFFFTFFRGRLDIGKRVGLPWSRRWEVEADTLCPEVSALWLDDGRIRSTSIRLDGWFGAFMPAALSGCLLPASS